MVRKTLDGRSANNAVADRFLSVEVRGVTNGEPVEISEIDVVGAR